MSKSNGKIIESTEGQTPALVEEPKFTGRALEEAYKYSVLGATDIMLAHFLGLSDIKALDDWRRLYPQLNQAIKEGKEMADASVAMAMLRRARGYDVPYKKMVRTPGAMIKDQQGNIVPYPDDYSERIETGSTHIPADVRAAEIWLYNRQPELWRRDPQSKVPIDPSKSGLEVEEDVIEIIMGRLTRIRAREGQLSDGKSASEELDE